MAGDAENPLDVIRTDTKIQDYNKRAKSKKFALDSSLFEEVKTYIIFAKPGRKPFEPNTAEDLKQLIAEMTETQSYRDRLAGVFMQAKTIISELDILKKAGEAYVYSEYSEQMKKCTNKETRDAAFNYILGPVLRLRGRWSNLQTSVEIARQNLNETYFALREIGENARTILADRMTKRTFD